MRSLVVGWFGDSSGGWLISTLNASLLTRVLLVEDDANWRDTLLDWLNCSGYEATAALDGLEAIALIRRQSFDVAITDLKMPNMDGLQLLALLSAQAPDLPVIFLSGEASIDDAIEALREGRSFDFLRKPLMDLNLINETIERALTKRRMAGNIPASLPDGPSDTASTENPILASTFSYIEAHFKEPINLSAVAQALGYSAPYLTDFVRRETGRSVQRWIIAYRLLEAKRLLKETDWSVQRVGEAIGYAHANHFVRQFRQHNGIPPQAWRNAEHNETDGQI